MPSPRRSFYSGVFVFVAIFLSSLLMAQSAPTLAQKMAMIVGSDEDSVLLWYMRRQVEWAKKHEADGDALLAKGKSAEALAAYQKAMGEVGMGSRGLGLEMERVTGGQRVTKVVAGRSAHQAQVQVGDILVSVDGFPLEGLDIGRLSVLLYMTEGIPVRPYNFVVKRADKTIPLSINRTPTFKDLANQGEKDYRDALEQKILNLILKNKELLPEVTENMKWAAKDRQQALQAAKGMEEIQYAAEDVRGAAYGFSGWADYYLNCGVLLEAAGSATEAEKCYKNFLLMKPEDPQAAKIAARFASLGELVRKEENLRKWEGGWHITKNGQKTERGYLFDRVGNLIKVKNHLGEIWVTATINDEFTASALQILTAKAMNGGPLEKLIDKCFGGKMEAAGTLRLSPDKKTLTMVINNDVDIDPTNCAMLRQNPSTTTYVR